MTELAGCKLGREEYGGDRYCYEHGGFVHLYGDPWCDKSPRHLAGSKASKGTVDDPP